MDDNQNQNDMALNASSDDASGDPAEEPGLADIAPEARVEVRDAVTPREEDSRWYTIHTYAGYENAVERNLKQRIESLGMKDRIFDVIVPTEKKIRVKSGKRI